ncbi:MAG: HAD family phosphatase [Gammaproteobacteria bacterium]|nr:HAD family phosphatase [Gammaproteobacteria bacterium]
MPEADTVDGLLFDLGGVILNIDFERALEKWQAWTRLPIQTLRDRLIMDEAYRQHERGEITPTQYFDHLRSLLELNADDAQIEQGWNAIFIGEVGETVDYIAAAAASLPCFLLSNSNPVHQRFWMREYHQALQPFKQVFVSSEIGSRKPEPAAFAYIAQATGIALNAMLLFDDTEENIHGAEALGMPAVHVTSHGDVKKALVELGLL